MCYEYVLLYVDDASVMSENAEHILQHEIGYYFDLKQKLNWSTQNLPGWECVQWS